MGCKLTNFSFISRHGVYCLALLLFLPALLFSQSTSQDFPTPVTTNEIKGTIKARDIGDARLTSYFYTFTGSQGDLFINVSSQNFNGDVDVFTADGLNPLTKIVMYADSSVNETGRVVYLRKPEKLILRVEGRTPGDDPATFTIKFAGSFIAAADTGTAQPELPKVVAENDTGVKVNSVGTIVAVTPKEEPKKAEVAQEPAVEEKKTAEETAANKPEPVEEKKLEVVVTDNIKPEGRVTKSAPPVRTVRLRRPPPKRTTAAKATKPPVEEKAPPKAKEPDPLENVHLVIEFKDGKRIERKMSEVFRFSIDKGVLTVISKDGSIGRYNILDIVRTTIE